MKDCPEIEKLWLAVQQSASTVVITNLDGKIEFVNPRFCELTGYSRSEVVGKNPRILKSGRTPPEVYREMWESISKGLDWHGELLNRRKDGSLYWGSLHISPLKDSTGQVTGFLGVEEDVTRAKSLEKSLRAANQELMRSNEDLRQFSTMVAHDVRAPLVNICGFLESVLESDELEFDEQTREYVELALASAKHAQGFSSELLKFARLGFESETKKSVRADYCLAAALASLSDMIVRRGAKIEHRQLPEVCACTTLLTQVFQNLIENAIKYSTRAPVIRISAVPGDGEWVFAVMDNGVGIPGDVLSKVFTPFARFHGRTIAHGNGLGLAACKRIVELHGGRMWLESKVGEGTTFYFTLPYLPADGESICTTDDSRPSLLTELIVL